MNGQNTIGLRKSEYRFMASKASIIHQNGTLNSLK